MSLVSLVLECGRLWKNASKSPAQIQADSLAAFRKMLAWAWSNTRFYPAYWKEFGISQKDLKTIRPDEIPWITKEDVREHFQDMTAIPVKKDQSGRWASRSGAIIVHSSGSTGQPAAFLYGKGAMTTVEANFVRLCNLGGENRVGFKDLPVQNIHAASVGKGYASTTLLGSGLSGYHGRSLLLKASDPLSKWVKTIGDNSPNFLSGYPSCLSLLLELQNSGQIHLRPLKIITGGEPLKEGLKRNLREAFGADVIDCYGCTESMLIGAGSSWYEGMYLFDDMNYCETDEQGHLIITPLYNRAFPLIRYKLDDLVKGFSKDHHGELPFTHIEGIIGRDADILWFVNREGLPDYLHPLVLDDIYAPGLKNFQFVQIDDHSFRLDCICESRKAAVKEELQKQLDAILKAKQMENLHYEICFPTKLRLNAQSGKVPLTIKENPTV